MSLLDPQGLGDLTGYVDDKPGYDRSGYVKPWDPHWVRHHLPCGSQVTACCHTAANTFPVWTLFMDPTARTCTGTPDITTTS